MVAKEVGQYTHQMQATLLQQLTGSVQLPVCLRVVGHIRRLGLLTEQQLRLIFLKVRAAALEKVQFRSVSNKLVHVDSIRLWTGCRLMTYTRT